MGDSTLASKIRSFSELQTLIQSYHTEFASDSENLYIYYITSFDTQDFGDRLAEVEDRVDKFDISVEKLESPNDRDLLRMVFTHEKDIHTISGYVLFDVDHEKNLIKAITDGGTDVIESSIQITDKLYPLFERFFISSDIIIEILEQFIEAGYSGYVTQYTAQKLWMDSETPKSAVEYPTDIPLSTVLEEVTEQPNIAVKMFRGSIHLDGEMLLEFYISREGEIRFLDGKHELFEEIINMVKQSAVEEISEYDGISKEGDEKEYLQIQFENIIEEKERDHIIERFRQAIQSESTFSEAVIHAGNPYYHSSLSDRARGSSFELVFFQDGEDFRLEILPNRTFASLSVLKFKRTLFSEFGEGNIKRKTIEG